VRVPRQRVHCKRVRRSRSSCSQEGRGSPTARSSSSSSCSGPGGDSAMALPGPGHRGSSRSRHVRSGCQMNRSRNSPLRGPWHSTSHRSSTWSFRKGKKSRTTFLGRWGSGTRNEACRQPRSRLPSTQQAKTGLSSEAASYQLSLLTGAHPVKVTPSPSHSYEPATVHRFQYKPCRSGLVSISASSPWRQATRSARPTEITSAARACPLGWTFVTTSMVNLPLGWLGRLSGIVIGPIQPASATASVVRFSARSP